MSPASGFEIGLLVPGCAVFCVFTQVEGRERVIIIIIYIYLFIHVYIYLCIYLGVHMCVCVCVALEFCLRDAVSLVFSL